MGGELPKVKKLIHPWIKDLSIGAWTRRWPSNRFTNTIEPIFTDKLRAHRLLKEWTAQHPDEYTDDNLNEILAMIPAPFKDCWGAKGIEHVGYSISSYLPIYQSIYLSIYPCNLSLSFYLCIYPYVLPIYPTNNGILHSAITF